MSVLHTNPRRFARTAGVLSLLAFAFGITALRTSGDTRFAANLLAAAVYCVVTGMPTMKTAMAGRDEPLSLTSTSARRRSRHVDAERRPPQHAAGERPTAQASGAWWTEQQGGWTAPAPPLPDRLPADAEQRPGLLDAAGGQLHQVDLERDGRRPLFL